MPPLTSHSRAFPADAPGLLAAEAADRPYPARFKGSSELSAAEQVAEVTALRAFEAEGLAPARLELGCFFEGEKRQRSDRR